jgi:DNA-directed RNA polymerase specialized sigma24 family protein
MLPYRPRRRVVSDRELDDLAASGPAADEHLCQPAATTVIPALRQALAKLAPDDRALIEDQYERGLRPVDIAAMRGLPQKQLYRRFTTILRQLKRDLGTQGITAFDVTSWISMAAGEPRLAAVLPFRK